MFCISLRCSTISCFFVKHKTAYEMRISDWSSDVCSSDLEVGGNLRYAAAGEAHGDDAALGRDTAQRPVEDVAPDRVEDHVGAAAVGQAEHGIAEIRGCVVDAMVRAVRDRKSTRLNSSH